jgi:hypothetical protein
MPALLTRMSSRPWRATIAAGAASTAAAVGDVERQRLGALAAGGDLRGALVGVIAARGGQSPSRPAPPAARQSPGRCRATPR